jgi:hypothetical protein
LRLCFVPKGIDAPGDVMLAQKISLETDEFSGRGVANVRKIVIARFNYPPLSY